MEEFKAKYMKVVHKVLEEIIVFDSEEDKNNFVLDAYEMIEKELNLIDNEIK